MISYREKLSINNDILIVDDALANRELLSDILKEEGYTTRLAEDGTTALKNINEKIPALILLDVKMPGMDGYEVCRRIKADPKLSVIPIIFISGLKDESNRVAGLNAGGVDYISKPFYAEEVIARVNVHFSLRCAQLELEYRNEELKTIQETLKKEVTKREWESKYNSISSEISSMILLPFSLEKLSKTILNYALSITNSKSGFVGFIDQKTGYVISPAFTDEICDGCEIQDKNMLFKSVSGLWGWVLKNKKPLLTNSPNDEERFKNILGPHSCITRFLASPALMNYHLYGIIAVGNSESDYEDKHQTFLNMLANKYALAINKIQTEDKLMKYSYVVEQSPIAIIITDENGIIEYVNQKFMLITGNSYDDILGRNTRFSEFSNELNNEYENISLLINQGKEWRKEFQTKRKNGELYWVSVYVSGVYNDEGKVTHFIAIMEDITERRHSDKQIRILAHTIKSITECICISDTDNNLYFVNDAFLKTYGYSEEEILGKNINIVDSPNNDPEINVRKDKNALSEGWEGELLNRRKDGTDFPIFLSTSVVRNESDEIIGLVGVARDITEQKKAAETLEKERNLLRTLIDNIPDRIYAKDIEGKFIICNKAVAERMKLREPQNLIGKTDFNFLSFNLADQYRKDEFLVIETGQPIINREEPMDDQSGETRWNLATKVPLRDKNGKIIGIVGMGREITEQKKAGEKIKKSEALFRSVWENSFTGMRIVDSEGKIIIVNNAFCKMVEKTKCELEGEPMSAIYKSEQSQHIIEKHKERFAARTVPAFFEKEVILWNGKVKWFELSNSYLELDTLCLLCVFKDITERKSFEKSYRESQERLLRSEKKYRQLVDTAQESIIRISNDSRITYTNQRMSELTGYNPEELIGMSFLSLLDKKNSQLFEEKTENRRRGISEQYELEIIKKDETKAFVTISASPETDDNGNFAGSFGILSDITEKKIIEDLLISERHLFNSLMDSTPDFIYFKDDEGKFIRINKSLAKFLGLKSPAEATGLGDYDFFTPDAAKIFMAEEMKIIKTGRPLINIDTMNAFKDGRIGWTSATKLPYRNSTGEIVGILGINRDITERKLMEEVLWKEKEELKVTLSSVGEGVITTNVNSTIILFNKKAEKITGWTYEEVFNKPLIEVLILITNKKDHVFINPVKIMIRSADSAYITDEAVLITKDKRDLIINYNLSPILDKANNYIGFVLVFRDITEQKMMESQSLLSQKMESIGQLASGISHEINTPMQYIGDNTRFLKDSFKDISEIIDYTNLVIEERGNEESFESAVTQLKELMEEVDLEYLRKEIPNAIDQSLVGIERVRGIVLAMKDFAHPGNKAKSFSDLNHGIEVTSTISKNEWKYVAEMELELEKDLPMVFCNLDEINQVILNMVVNSSHSIKEKQDKETSNKGKIKIVTQRDADYIMIKIIDTGKGIPKQIIDKIFDPFFTTKEVGKGTGQGLAIAHNIIVKNHKGTIHVESEPGKGTTFTLRLPINEQKNETTNG
jgi:two-component system, NtrC family, sensor kinase